MKSTTALALTSAMFVACLCTPIDGERAVFTGAADAEPIKVGFRRDRVLQHVDGFQILNSDKPYRNYQDHVFEEFTYDATWPNFFQELDNDIHPEVVEAIGSSDFKLSITLDPKSAPLIPHTELEGQRFGIYLQFDNGQALGGSYMVFGFDSLGGDIEPGNRPFALVGQGYWSYYIDPRDCTGTAETLTLVRRGDVFQLYTSSEGSSFLGVAGQRDDGEVYADINGTLPVKPNVILDIGPNRILTALTLWTESADSTLFDGNAGRLRSLVIESDALTRDINPESHVSPLPALPVTDGETGSTVELSGVVRDEASSNQIYYAHVSIQRDDLSYVVITDGEGTYKASLNPGTYELEVTAKGYERQTRSIKIENNLVSDFRLTDVEKIHRVGASRDHRTIQSALDVANDGDSIYLDPGTYKAPLDLISNVTIKGAGADQTTLVKNAYRDIAITPFLAEYYPPYGIDGVVLKAALLNVELEAFTLDGGEDYESFNAETIAERLALLMAIDRVDLDTVSDLLRSNPDLAKVRYYTEDSPHTGATFLTRNMDPWVRWTPERRADNVGIAKLLISNGADIEGHGGYAWSSEGRPLHIAANHDNVGVARLLLDAGADPNSIARDRTPLEWANGQGTRVASTAAVLIEGGADYTLLDLARFKLHDRLEQELGTQINDLFPVSDAEPTSMLHIAVRNNLHDVVEWLLERGANPDLEDANGLTPKQVATSMDRSDAVHGLLGLEKSTGP